MIGRIVGRRKQFDMIDLRAIGPGNPMGAQRLAHLPGKGGELGLALQGELERVLSDEKKPVASPGHVAVYDAIAGQFHRHMGPVPIGLHVGDGDLVILRQRNRHIPDRSLQPVRSRADAAQVRERGGHADGAVAAHAKVAGVVEENHAGRGRRIYRLQ